MTKQVTMFDDEDATETNHNTDVMFSSDFMDWETPQEFVDSLPFKFDLDVCALHSNAKCKSWLSPSGTGALEKTWAPRVCWMNPPYGRQVGKWVEKAYQESLKGATVVCLVPNRTEAIWFDKIWAEASIICFLGKRIAFTHPDPTKQKNGAPFANVLAVFSPFLSDERELARKLSVLGTVILPGSGNIWLHEKKKGK